MVEFAPMIGIGSIEFGPEISRRPISGAIHRLNATLGGAASFLDIVFVVPGKLGKADFEGYKVRRGSKGKPPVVFAEVPSDLASATDPLPGLIDLARRAVRRAAPVLTTPTSPGRLGVDVEDLEAALDAAERSLGVRSTGAPDTHEWTPVTVSRVGRADADRAGVQISLPVRDRGAMVEALDLETRIEQRLDSDSAGFIDGNEVGEGLFTIYAYGPIASVLRRSIEVTVREHWRRPGAVLRLMDGDNEVASVVL